MVNDFKNIEEEQYLDLLRKLIGAKEKSDRTGVGTRSVFGNTMRFSLKNGTVPLITTKKVYWKGVVEELLFFIRGERDSKKLEEKGVRIWTGNTTKDFIEKRGLSYNEGDIGPMYGVQWRDFGGTIHPGTGVDQLRSVLELIKTNPDSRRMVVTAYNPQEKDLGVLEPCHMIFQFNVTDGLYLDCMFYMRSWDVFLGGPFNIASYALLTHMFAKASGLLPGELVVMSGDTHLYSNHIEAAKEQVSRTPNPFPRVAISKQLTSVEDMERLSYSDIILSGYYPHPAIKAEMAI